MPSTIAKTPTGIGRKAQIIKHSDLFRVQLYSTIVYLETPTRIELNNGGWVTPTTARYINQALTHRGFQGGVVIRKGEMFFQVVIEKTGLTELHRFVNNVYTFKKAVA